MMEESKSYSEGVQVVNDTVVRPPSRYNVVMYNDNKTPMGFVTGVLETIFSFQTKDAIRVMLTIHKNGKGVVATYIKSIAEWKKSLVDSIAKNAGYPLRTEIERIDGNG